MTEGINGVYNRINEIRNGAKTLSKFQKPEMVKEFENMYNNSIKEKSTQNTKEESIHPFLKKQETELVYNSSPENTKEVKKDDKSAIDEAISTASKKYKVSEDLIRSVISVESGFNKTVVSRTGAMGLMQLMPKTAFELGVEKPFDIYENIDGGVKYLRMMLDRYDNDLEKALSAYNAGPHRVDAANGIPNIEETQNYVRLIKKKLLK